MTIEYSKLDNSVWYSLSETHQNFCLDFGGTKFYKPDVCAFGGFVEKDGSSTAILKYSNLADNFYIVGNKPEVSNSLQLRSELICLQMIHQHKPEITIVEEIVQLGQEHSESLFNLVNLVQPGYFKTKTSQLGNYYGIFKDNQLVAVTGERMKLDGFVEISAVVTHPGYKGRGYARQLITHAIDKTLQANQFPFLHVAGTNSGAIRIYESLGFDFRRKISFWNINF